METTVSYNLSTSPDTKTFGPTFWKAFHDLAGRIPCEKCRDAGTSFMVFFHDMTNNHLGKPIYDRQNFDLWVDRISRLKESQPRETAPEGCPTCKFRNDRTNAGEDSYTPLIVLGVGLTALLLILNQRK